jgi:hypothetical protein
VTVTEEVKSRMGLAKKDGNMWYCLSWCWNFPGIGNREQVGYLPPSWVWRVEACGSWGKIVSTSARNEEAWKMDWKYGGVCFPSLSYHFLSYYPTSHPPAIPPTQTTLLKIHSKK